MASTSNAAAIQAGQTTSTFQALYIGQTSIMSHLYQSSTVGGLAFLAGQSVQTEFAADLPGGRRPEATPVPINILDPRAFSIWGSGFGSFGSSRGSAASGTLTRDTGGFVAGADVTINGMWKVGVAGGYTNTSTDQRTQLATANIESGFGAIYGGAGFGPLRVRLGAIGDGISADSRRISPAPAFGTTLTASYGGSAAAGFGEIGYNIPAGAAAAFEPFAGGSAIYIHRDGFTEAGGLGAATVFSRGYDIQTVTAGARGNVAFSEDSPFSIRGLIAYRHAFGDVVPRALLSLAGGGTQFQTAGIPIARDAIVAEAGIDWQVSPATLLEVAYTGQVGSRADDHGVKGSIQYKF